MTRIDRDISSAWRRGPAWLVVVVVVAAACNRQAGESILARGTVEVPEIDLAAPVAARILSIRADEGVDVRAGDTVALLTQADLPSALAAQRARVGMAQANLRDLEVGARPEELRRATTEVEAARAEAERAAADQDRMRSLFAKQVISKQQLDQAEAAARIGLERKRGAEESLAMLRAGTRRDRVSGARADLANATAALGMVEARATDLVLIAPVAGRILTRQAEPGEWLAPGAAPLTLGEIGRPYVRVFVPASRLAGITIGDTATVVVDGTDQALGTARVIAINTKAEFTPRVALTEKERADLLFGVKLEFVHPTARIHPGLWVGVRFGT